LPHLKGAGDKEAQEHLKGKWLIEVSELDSFRKAETTAIKSFVSKQEDDYRKAYGRGTEKHKRTCVFVATTNEDTYLDDPSGNRRYWPLRADKADLAALKQERDQLLAEAVVVLNAGGKWWPDRETEKLLFMPEQEKREKAPDVWIGIVGEWLLQKFSDDKQARVSTADTLEMAIMMPKDRMNRGSEMRIAAIYRKLGLIRIGDNNNRRWRWPDDVRAKYAGATNFRPKPTLVSRVTPLSNRRKV
jgi:putative DNA primase/helicase